MSGPEILVAEFAHESNTFVHDTTDREDFEDRRALFGAEVIDEMRGTNSEVAGFVSVLEEHDWGIRPAMAVSATPGGVVERETFEHYWEQLADAIESNLDRIDGVALALHGAMVLEDHQDGDGLIIKRVRELVGADVPIAVTVDLHTNVTDRMLSAADVLVAYEEYPHTDTFETGETAAEILVTVIEDGLDPAMHVERPPVLSSGPNQNTSISPMQDLMSLAREAEEDDEVFKVNVTPGFFRSDIPEAGLAVSTVARSADLARDTTREIATAAWEARAEFIADYPSPAEAVEIAADRVAAGATADGPIVLGDVGDNPGGGAAGDETAMLRAVLDQGLSNAGVVLIHDPEAVEACRDAGVRSDVTLDLGAKKVDSYTEPIHDLDGYVKAITDGRFHNTGPMGTGTATDTGHTVLLRCGDDVSVVVTDKRIQPLDAELWRHVGVQPERLDVIVVKSANHYRADYDRLAAEVIPVDSPGGNTIDPNDYDYDRIRRPIFPLDEVPDYPPW